MNITIRGAREHNLQGVDVEIGDGLTVITGVSGSGKTSLAFDTLYHEARRRFLDIFSLGSQGPRLSPAVVDTITGLGPAVAVGQNLLNRNPGSTLATASGLHPFLRLLYARFGTRACAHCGTALTLLSDDEIVERLVADAAGLPTLDATLRPPKASLRGASFAPKQSPPTQGIAHLHCTCRCVQVQVSAQTTGLATPALHQTQCGASVTPHERLSASGPLVVTAPLVRRAVGSHATLLALLADHFGAEAVLVDGAAWDGRPLDPAAAHTIELEVARFAAAISAGEARAALERASALVADAVIVRWSVTGAERAESVTYSRAPVCAGCGAWFGELRPLHFHQPCPHCEGKGCGRCADTGLHPQAAATRWAGLRLPELLACSVDEVWPRFEHADLPTSADRLRSEIVRRLDALRIVGLGYIALDRPAPTLSRGEAQRVRLAVALTSRLEDMLHVLDEPTVGQHPADVARLLPAFRRLAGPVVYVEHDRLAAAQADQAIDLGPGAGSQGGRVVFTGAPAELWAADTLTGRYFSLRQRVAGPGGRPAPRDFLTVRGAHLRNLAGIDVPIPLGRLTVITGVSGSGKSTLVEDVLVASLSAGRPVGCAGLEGPPIKPVFVDQSPIGRNPRSNPATYTKLADIIRDLFASVTGLSPSHFSFNRPEGACPACQGMGAVEVTMRYLPSTWTPCAECGGQRFSDEVLAATIPLGGRDLSIAGIFERPVSEVAMLLADEPRLPAGDRRAAASILAALCDIGLGYLPLGQPSPTLSGGEAQRVKLARTLGQRALAGQLLVLDEPSTGLHPHDLAGLLIVLDRLARAGATVVVVEHNTDIIRAADWVVDLGPGAGPSGGRLLYAGPPAGLLDAPDSLTGQALRDETAPTFPAPDRYNEDVRSDDFSRPARCGATEVATTNQRAFRAETRSKISIRDARANNLRGVDADFPKGKLTVVTGVSGSGKSSLVGDVLEAEARRRFLEMLSMYERQGTHEGPEAPVGGVSGLGVAVAIGPERMVYSRRATLGSATELAHHLAALLATVGERRCAACGARLARDVAAGQCPTCGAATPAISSRHFLPTTYAAACLTCHGVGTRQEPNPAKLIIAPEKPLCAGAMYSPGFFPKGYLGEPFNGGYYVVRALAERYGFDPELTPWREMSPEAQQAFLFGDERSLLVHYESRTGRQHTHEETFRGFYGWVRDWDLGGTYTDTQPCPACGGRRLRPAYLAVTLAGSNIHQLSGLPLARLAEVLAGLALPADALPAVHASLETARRRLRFLCQVGLGYLHLDRIAATLSAGEAQRGRLAGLLGSGLTSLTVLLDEPTRGLHPVEVDALLAALQELRDEGNTVIVVEHDPQIIAAADHIIEMGPGAGAAGGQVVAQGAPAELLAGQTLTAAWLRGDKKTKSQREIQTARSGLEALAGLSGQREQPAEASSPDRTTESQQGIQPARSGLEALAGLSSQREQPAEASSPEDGEGIHNRIPRPRRSPAGWLTIRGARANNLAGETIRLPLGVLAGVCGVSGSGKSTLIIDTLGRALAPKKQTTSVAYEPVEPGEHDAIEAAPARAVVVDQSRAGVHSPLSFLDLGRPLRELFAASADAMALGLSEEQLGEKCSACGGRGIVTVEMEFLPDVHETCETCRGTGLLPEAWDVRLRGVSLPQVYGITLDQTYDLFGNEPALARPLAAARAVGLGYLVLRQPGHTLSGGEAQRLKIAKELCRRADAGTLYLLDEPTVGQHLADVARLNGVLHRLVDDGHSVLVVEHHPHLLAACDWLVELGPGGGEDGGRVIASGPPETLAAGQTPIARYLRDVSYRCSDHVSVWRL